MELDSVVEIVILSIALQIFLMLPGASGWGQSAGGFFCVPFSPSAFGRLCAPVPQESLSLFLLFFQCSLPLLVTTNKLACLWETGIFFIVLV